MPRTWTVYLVRHGIAEERGPSWPDDAKRPLTDKGVRQLRRTARGLVHLGVSIDVLLSSPLVRARQTAEVLASVLEPAPGIVLIDSLAPGAAHSLLVADLAKHARLRSLALIGHEPGLGAAAARLAGLRRALEFRKGAVCRVDLDEMPPGRPGTLRWFAPPRLLRRIR